MAKGQEKDDDGLFDWCGRLTACSIELGRVAFACEVLWFFNQEIPALSEIKIIIIGDRENDYTCVCRKCESSTAAARNFWKLSIILKRPTFFRTLLPISLARESKNIPRRSLTLIARRLLKLIRESGDGITCHPCICMQLECDSRKIPSFHFPFILRT